MTFNAPEFQRQLETYAAVATKEVSVAYKKKILDTAYTAAKLTPKLDRADIKADLHRDPHLIAALTSLRLRKEGREKLGKGLFKAEMRALELTRQAGAAYMVAGWGPVIEALGGKWDKGKKGKHGGASAKMIRSYAQLTATGATLVWITDQDTSRKQEGAERVAERAMIAAMEYQIDDMETYIARKLSETFD
jgi:hypothetical protein